MFAHEFESVIGPDGSFRVPDELLPLLPTDQAVRVLILVDDSTEEDDWNSLTTEQFFKGYTDEDANDN
jgi:hypothetical protein